MSFLMKLLRLKTFVLDQVNEIRLQNGLTKLPHIQQELEARLAK